jgi:large subunit ribosomal protein L29
MTKQNEARHELRRMTVAELDDYLLKQRRRLFEVRFQQATGQVENHRQVREIRHEIARAMTVKIEIERGLRPEIMQAATAPATATARVTKPRKPRAPRLEVPAVVPAAVPVEASPAAADPSADAGDEEAVDE